MGEQVQYSYQCQNLGCSNGHLSAFDHAPPEWWAEKGLSEPKNCPDCRAWVKAQVDSQENCHRCGFVMSQTAKAKISHHKRMGAYKRPTECRHCTLGREMGKRAVGRTRQLSRRIEPRRGSTSLDDKLKEDGYRESTVSRQLITDESYYIGVPQHSRTDETRQEHIQVHAPWTAAVPGKSKTTLGSSAGTLAGLLQDACKLAGLQAPNVYEKEQRGGRVIRVDSLTGDKIVLRVEDPGPPPEYSLVTAYNLEDSQ